MSVVRKFAGVRWLGILALCAVLSSCGGGGSGDDEDLVVSFTYNGQRAQLWRSTSISPSTTGLRGNGPTCTLSSGALPSGLTLQSNCAITGTPTAFGSYQIGVRMTVSGYSGSVSNFFEFTVNGPALTWPSLFAGRFMVSGNYNIPATNINASMFPNWQPAAGETVNYQVLSGALPPGMTLNATTGAISGAPSAAGVFPVSIRATVTGNGRTATGDANISIVIEDPALSISYPNGSAQVGQAFSVAPSLYAPVESFSGATFVYSLRTDGGSLLGTLPAGLTLDPATGVISGTPTTPDALGGHYYGIALDVTRNGVTFQLPTSVWLYVQP